MQTQWSGCRICSFAHPAMLLLHQPLPLPCHVAVGKPHCPFGTSVALTGQAQRSLRGRTAAPLSLPPTPQPRPWPRPARPRPQHPRLAHLGGLRAGERTRLLPGTARPLGLTAEWAESRRPCASSLRFLTFALVLSSPNCARAGM